MKTVRMREVMVSVLFFLMILSAMGLTLPRALADDGAVDNVEITVNISCSMTGTVTGGHTETMMNGETSQIGGTTTLKTVCNDNSGYAIYAIGYTDNEYGKTVLTDHSLDSSYDIVTSGTIDSSTSSWAMKLATSGSSYVPIIVGSLADSLKETNTPDYTAYQAVPSEYAKVVYYTSSTDAGTSALGSSVVATYRAYVSWLQPAGTYIGQVKYTLVHPSTASEPVVPLKDTDCPAGYVCYAPNANDIEGSMATLGAITSSNKAGRVNLGTSATTANLIAPNYKRSGYGFAGWSTSFDATVATNPVIYGPNETITVNLSSSGLILYPVWVENAGNLQSFSCANSSLIAAIYDSEHNKVLATLGSITALTDTRDGNVYAVAKLADGKCWMIENLRLDNTATITVNNTNNPLHDASNIVILKTDYTNGTTDTHLAASYSGTWCIQVDQASCLDQTMLNTNNIRILDSSLTASYNGSGVAYKWYGYGNYYNWYSATAGNGTYSFSLDSGSVSGDLCPTGWHLPYGGSGAGTNGGNTVGGFYYLNTQMSNDRSDQGSKDWRMFPNNFVYSGNWGSTQATSRGSVGHYWSSLASGFGGDGGAYELYFHNTLINPGTQNSLKNDGSAEGYSVRCVAGS